MTSIKSTVCYKKKDIQYIPDIRLLLILIPLCRNWSCGSKFIWVWPASTKFTHYEQWESLNFPIPASFYYLSPTLSLSPSHPKNSFITISKLGLQILLKLYLLENMILKEVKAMQLDKSVFVSNSYFQKNSMLIL